MSAHDTLFLEIKTVFRFRHIWRNRRDTHNEIRAMIAQYRRTA